MGHPRRVFIPGVSVHVIRRGVNRCAIVGDDDDRKKLLETIKAAAARHDVAIHGYTVMDNHYHMLVTPGAEGALSRMMKMIGERYVKYFNRKYDRIGTLWAGRFRAKLVEDERQWLTCLRYIELNAVSAAMVDSPAEYRWSSYRFHGCGEPTDWLVAHPLYLALGSTPALRQITYTAICAVN